MTATTYEIWPSTQEENVYGVMKVIKNPKGDVLSAEAIFTGSKKECEEYLSTKLG